MTKVCTRCKEEKPKTCYRSRGGKQKHLLKSYCNDCLAEDRRRWAEKHPDSIRHYRSKDKWTLKKRCARHNITQEEFWSIYENQDGTCPICDKAIEAETSAIDHNHKTGEVRGILCGSCNRALGMLGDNPDNLLRAEKYLRENGHYG